MFKLTILGLLLSGSLAYAGVGPQDEEVAPVQDLRWQVNAADSFRYYLDSEVYLPQYMWFMTSDNDEVRVTSFRVRALIDCVPSFYGKRSTELTCDIEDASLNASALPGDAGLLGPVLLEMEQKLTGSELMLTLRDDGRLLDVALTDVDSRNRRRNAIRENLRLVMIRALAGLDLQLPREGTAPDRVWTQQQSRLLGSPAPKATFGSARITHRITAFEDGRAFIHTTGRVTMVPEVSGGMTGYRSVRGGGRLGYFSGFISGDALFDTQTGRLLVRTWAVETMPTASSFLAEGSMGFPYSQWGQLLALEPGEVVSVGESYEVAPPDLGPTVSRQQAYARER